MEMQLSSDQTMLVTTEHPNAAGNSTGPPTVILSVGETTQQRRSIFEAGRRDDLGESTKTVQDDDAKSTASSAGIDLALDAEFDDELSEADKQGGGECCEGGCRIRISFQAQIIFFMSIPIVFLVVFSSMAFVDNFAREDFIQLHRPLLEAIDDCAAQLNHERRSMSFYDVAFRENMTGPTTVERYGIMQYERALSDKLCGGAALQAERSTDPRIAVDYAQDMRGMMTNLSLLRHRIDTNRLSRFEQRETMKRFIYVVEEAIAYLALNSMTETVQTNLMRLKAARSTANLLAMFRSSGTVGFADELLLNALTIKNIVENDAAWEGLVYARLNLESALRGTPIYPYYLSWANDSTTKMIENNWFLLGQKSTVNPLEFFGNATTSLAIFNLMIPKIREAIVGDRTQSDRVMLEGIRLGVAVTMCLISAAFIVRAQFTTAKQVEFEVHRTKRLHGAVTKFVPRAFLKLMGCNSIMHIRAGDQTEVAVTMVFAAITNFGSLTAEMDSHAIFLWLGDFFQRVSVGVHHHKGFVDKFLGDATFAVFMHPMESLKASLAILSVVDQFNVEWVAKGGKQYVHMGVGAHCAVVSVGILGDHRRHTCTLISSEVNLASRLQGLTKYYGSRMIMSAPAVEQTYGSFESRHLGRAKVKGQEGGVSVYDIYQADALPVKQFKTQTKAAFERAAKLQDSGSLDEARGIFSQIEAEARRVGIEDKALAVKINLTKPLDEFLSK